MDTLDNPLHSIRSITVEVAARHAADVDQKSRFPTETIAALKQARLLSAAVPRELGGGGANMQELAATCATLAQGCGSSGMILAMHHIQVACLVRHAAQAPFFRQYLQDLAEH